MRVGVFSDVREYDQSDFPSRGGIARMMVYADATGEGVTVDSTPTGNGKRLGWDSGNKLWVRTFDTPPIGADWETTYVFHSGSSTLTLDISSCTIQKLTISEVTISADGRTISWNSVERATYYSIYWYPIRNGLPYESGGPLIKIDRIDDTSLTLSNPIPGTYALRLNAHEICSHAIVNRSTIYKKHTIPDVDHFVFSEISPQAVGTPFTVTITAKDENGYQVLGFNGNVSLTSNLGAVSPTSAKLVSGQVTVSVKLYAPGSTRLNCSGYGAYGDSNYFNVTGGSTCSGKILGKVIDARGDDVYEADVKLYDCEGQLVGQSYTDSEGKFAFTGIDCGTYQIKAEKNCEPTTVSGICISSTSSQNSHKLEDIRLQLNSGTIGTPVILVMGMMGSTRYRDKMYPRLSKNVPCKELYPWDYIDPSTGYGTSGWYQLFMGLNNFNFKVFFCPWDWRLKCEEAYKEFLIKTIDIALKASTTGKVHIVAHSMGGLLARAYIQGGDYRGDIDKLAMVGTPHLGSCNPYYIWEGGDPLTLDGITNSGWKILLSPYTRTLRILWDTYDKWFWSEWRHTAIRNFVRKEVPSVRQLTYTENFLKDKSGTFSVETDGNENTWLKSLNTGQNGYVSPSVRMSSDGNGKVEVRLFVGKKDASTLRYLYTLGRDSPLFKNHEYEDGIPTQVEKGVGDGTVPYESAIWPKEKGWAYLYGQGDGENFVSEEHISLVKAYETEIISFLLGVKTSSIMNENYTRGLPADNLSGSGLSFSVMGDMRLLVTDPGLKSTGINPESGDFVGQIPNSSCSFNSEGGALSVKNPTQGTYNATFFGEAQRTFYLDLAYTDDKTTETLRFMGFCPDAPRTFTVSVSPSATPRISVTPPAIAPTGLRADPYTSEDNEYARLSWNVTGEAGISGYNVYSVAELDPYFAKVATVTAGETSYNSNDKWCSDSYTQVITYAVTAVKSDGTESFFSNLAQNNDQDHDGLTDAEETELGTDPTKADTDGDGLKDGEEQAYRTNPLVADTDGDTFNDGDEVAAGTNPLDPNSIPETFGYVATSGGCSGNEPCYTTIQEAVNGARNGGIVRIKEGSYAESVTLGSDKKVTLQGGWDAAFASQSGTTTLIQAPKAPQGTLTLQMLNIKPE
jgi:pimeloyl-ACP methyl ester carboxylesterase